MKNLVGLALLLLLMQCSNENGGKRPSCEFGLLRPMDNTDYGKTPTTKGLFSTKKVTEMITTVKSESNENQGPSESINNPTDQPEISTDNSNSRSARTETMDNESNRTTERATPHGWTTNSPPGKNSTTVMTGLGHTENSMGTSGQHQLVTTARPNSTNPEIVEPSMEGTSVAIEHRLTEPDHTINRVNTEGRISSTEGMNPHERTTEQTIGQSKDETTTTSVKMESPQNSLPRLVSPNNLTTNVIETETTNKRRLEIKSTKGVMSEERTEGLPFPSTNSEPLTIDRTLPTLVSPNYRTTNLIETGTTNKRRLETIWTKGEMTEERTEGLPSPSTNSEPLTITLPTLVSPNYQWNNTNELRETTEKGTVETKSINGEINEGTNERLSSPSSISSAPMELLTTKNRPETTPPLPSISFNKTGTTSVISPAKANTTTTEPTLVHEKPTVSSGSNDTINSSESSILPTSFAPEDGPTTVFGQELTEGDIGPMPECPSGYVTGNGGCLRFGAGTSYLESFNNCLQSRFGIMADEHDLEDNREGLIRLLEYGFVDNMNVFVNAHASHEMRQTKNISIYYISTSGLIRQIGMAPYFEKTDKAVGAVCKIPAFGKPAVCDVRTSFTRNKPNLTPVKELQDNVISGSLVDFTCHGEKSHVDLSIRCGANGEILPHFSMLEQSCNISVAVKPVSKVEDTTVAACEECTSYGTERCDSNSGSHRCVCRPGWTGSNCWRSPRFCEAVDCGIGARCLNMIDRHECVCETEDCEARQRWAARTDTAITLLDAAAMTSLAGSVGNLWFKLVKNMFMTGPSQNPQEDFQELRSIFNGIAGALTVLYARPEVLNITKLEQRLWGASIMGSYAASGLFWWQESSNALRTVKGESLNKWMTSDLERTSSNYFYRVGLTITLIVASMFALMGQYWDSIATPWSSTGRFTLDADLANMYVCKIVLIILAPVALHATVMASRALHLYTKRQLPKAALERMLEHDRDRERVRMVLRNLHFCATGPLVQYAFTASLLLANDLQTCEALNKLAVLFSCLNSGINLIQGITTTVWVNYPISFIQLLFPRHAPRINEITGRSIEETKRRYRRHPIIGRLMKKFEKTENDKKDEENKQDSDERALIEEKRRTLLDKYPGLSPTCLPHIPLPGPPPFHQFEYLVDDEGSMTSYRKDVLMSLWTVEYLLARREKSMEEALQETVCKALEESVTGWRKGETGPATEADLTTAIKEWLVMMRSQDRIDFVCSQNIQARARLIDENATPWARIQTIGAHEYKERPPSQAKVVNRMLNRFVDRTPEEEEYNVPFIRLRHVVSPPILSLSQEEEATAALDRTLEAKNEEWNRIFDDDQWIVDMRKGPNAAFLEEIVIHPAYPEEGRIKCKSVNPRKRMTWDDWWFDARRPGFVGPLWPEQMLVAGPRLHRFRLEEYVEPIRQAWRRQYELIYSVCVQSAIARDIYRF